jgi:hypothetical protein
LKPGKKYSPILHAARRRVGGGLVHDRADAAEVDVAVVGDELERGRREVDGERLLERRLVALERVPERAQSRALTRSSAWPSFRPLSFAGSTAKRFSPTGCAIVLGGEGLLDAARGDRRAHRRSPCRHPRR